MRAQVTLDARVIKQGVARIMAEAIDELVEAYAAVLPAPAEGARGVLRGFSAWLKQQVGLEEEAPPDPLPLPMVWDRDISAELATNERCPPPLQDGWWSRTLEQIDGLTFHHTLSHSPHATARNYVRKGGGRPSLPYTLWVTETGEILKCGALTAGCWHDHTGHENTHLSVGLAGSLHQVEPSEAQLDAAAKVAAWAVRHPGMNVALDTVNGHGDYYSTVCPGWGSAASGNWRPRLYRRIRQRLGVAET